MSADDSQGLRLAVQIGLAVLGATLLCALCYYTATGVAAEDAIILHQYSKNLAETGVISYRPNGPPAEGATDFLWMIYIAFGMKLHLSAGVCSAAANVVSLVAMAFTLIRIAGQRATSIVMLGVIGCFAMWPQMEAALKGFCVLPFALLWVLTVFFLLRKSDSAAALCALVLCLVRPDGVVFAVPALMILGIVHSKTKAHTLSVYFTIFVIPGLIYFLWRWHYFGHLFPLPFVVKSHAHRVLGLFIVDSVEALAPFPILTLLVLGAVLGSHAFENLNFRLIWVLFVLPTLFYANIRLEQNLNGRFFFYFPVGVALLTAVNWNYWRTSRLRLGFVVPACIGIAFFSFVSVLGFWDNITTRSELRQMRSLATELSAPPLRGTMLTSEAGLFPYFSRWAAYDSWGLNTPEYAYHLIQPEQVVELRPDIALLSVHPFDDQNNCRLERRPVQDSRKWSSMTNNVQTGLAMLDDYDVWETPYGLFKKQLHAENPAQNAYFMCWYISRTYKEAPRVEEILNRYQGVPVI